jgi:hypothetical protein
MHADGIKRYTGINKELRLFYINTKDYYHGNWELKT